MVRKSRFWLHQESCLDRPGIISSTDWHLQRVSGSTPINLGARASIRAEKDLEPHIMMAARAFATSCKIQTLVNQGRQRSDSNPSCCWASRSVWRSLNLRCTVDQISLQAGSEIFQLFLEYLILSVSNSSIDSMKTSMSMVGSPSQITTRWARLYILLIC
jgi:hypothetical protein